VSFVAFIIRALFDVVFQEDAKNYRLFIPKRSNSTCKNSEKSSFLYLFVQEMHKNLRFLPIFGSDCQKFCIFAGAFRKECKTYCSIDSQSPPEKKRANFQYWDCPIWAQASHI
jgi:hypothetical protein